MKKLLLPFLIIIIIICSCESKQTTNISVIPEPVSTELHKGHFTIDENTVLCFDGFLRTDLTAIYIRDYYKKYLGLEAKIPETIENKNSICFKLCDDLDPILGEEGYELAVNKNNIVVSAKTTAGIFYGFQTLCQLAPPDASTGVHTTMEVPCLKIVDYPRFTWRGSHLDVCRHFFDTDFIRKYIDVLALHKINKFHWHLTDDHGWRIQIDKYPKLTEVGAWRVDRSNVPWTEGLPPEKGEPTTYGGYYTKDDMKKIVDYAAKRNIEVIPEIELPGHSSAILAAYPEFGCDVKNQDYYVQIGPYWPPVAILCAGNDKTLDFLKDVIDEVIEIFPSEYIHIGGDEAYKTNWEKCPRCQKRMKDEGLKNEEELQSWMVKEIEKHIISHDKKMIGWDEILEGGVSPTSVVMSWRGNIGGIEAAKHGNHVIMTPNDLCYLDYYQADPEFQPVSIGGYVPLKKTYSFDPVPDALNNAEAELILGGQCNLWTEFISTPDHVEYMLLPRLSALSEAVWSPKDKKDWYNFRNKIENQKIRLGCLGYNYCDGNYKPIITTTPVEGNKLSVSIESDVKGTDIHYTVDGSEPTINSPLFEKPFEIEGCKTIKAIAVYKGEVKESVAVAEVFTSKLTGKKITITPNPTDKYTANGVATIADGVLGSERFTDGKWIGFYNDHVIIDIENNNDPFTTLFLHTLIDQNAWVFAAKSVELLTSDDGSNYTAIQSVSYDTDKSTPGMKIKKFEFSFAEPISPKYLRIKVNGLSQLPEWHLSAGKMPWLFIDEVVMY